MGSEPLLDLGSYLLTLRSRGPEITGASDITLYYMWDDSIPLKHLFGSELRMGTLLPQFRSR